jgi:hypothetical protein
MGRTKKKQDVESPSHKKRRIEREKSQLEFEHQLEELNVETNATPNSSERDINLQREPRRTVS